jgi:hypothetical protein
LRCLITRIRSCKNGYRSLSSFGTPSGRRRAKKKSG